MSMNSCNFTGRLTADIELKYTNGGKAVTEFTLAIEDGYGDNKKVYFLRFTAWEKTAEYLSKNAIKGNRIAVNSKAVQSDWTDNETGKKQQKTHFQVLQAELIDYQRRDSQQQPQSQPPASQHTVDKGNAYQPQNDPQGRYSQADNPVVDDSSEIPF